MIQQSEFNRIPEIVLERNLSILTTDEFRYYMHLKYFEVPIKKNFSENKK